MRMNREKLVQPCENRKTDRLNAGLDSFAWTKCVKCCFWGLQDKSKDAESRHDLVSQLLCRLTNRTQNSSHPPYEHFPNATTERSTRPTIQTRYSDSTKVQRNALAIVELERNSASFTQFRFKNSCSGRRPINALPITTLGAQRHFRYAAA